MTATTITTAEILTAGKATFTLEGKGRRFTFRIQVRRVPRPRLDPLRQAADGAEQRSRLRLPRRLRSHQRLDSPDQKVPIRRQHRVRAGTPLVRQPGLERP